MNTYEIRVNNATITSKAVSEWSAMAQLCLFKVIGGLVDYVRTSLSDSINDAWIYEVELNGQITLAYVKRIA